MAKKQEKINSLCPIRYLLNIFGGKWKLPVLCILEYAEPVRYGQIKKRLGNITDVMLSQTLKELERDKILMRRQYNEVPPRVEYTLTSKGRSVLIALEDLTKWATENMKQENYNPGCKKCLSDETLNLKQEA